MAQFLLIIKLANKCDAYSDFLLPYLWSSPSGESFDNWDKNNVEKLQDEHVDPQVLTEPEVEESKASG